MNDTQNLIDRTYFDRIDEVKKLAVEWEIEYRNPKSKHVSREYTRGVSAGLRFAIGILAGVPAKQVEESLNAMLTKKWDSL